jgi:hypothetical protein
MRSLSIITVILASQFAEGAEPKLTKELWKKVQAGEGKLTEEEVLKLVPGTVKVTRGGNGELTLTWEEAAIIDVELVNGKVESTTAQFNDTVDSKRLTIEKYKAIKTGMTQQEINKVLGDPNSSESSANNMAQTQTSCRWSQGRRLFVYIKDGKVNGGGFVDGGLP